jgi:hypothetical protein
MRAAISSGNEMKRASAIKESIDRTFGIIDSEMKPESNKNVNPI